MIRETKLLSENFRRFHAEFDKNLDEKFERLYERLKADALTLNNIQVVSASSHQNHPITHNEVVVSSEAIQSNSSSSDQDNIILTTSDDHSHLSTDVITSAKDSISKRKRKTEDDPFLFPDLKVCFSIGI